MKCSAIRTPLHSGCMDLQREEVAMCGNVHFAEEEVAMCLAWIGFHEDSGSNCTCVPTWRLFQLFSETVAFCEDKRMC